MQSLAQQDEREWRRFNLRNGFHPDVIRRQRELAARKQADADRHRSEKAARNVMFERGVPQWVRELILTKCRELDANPFLVLSTCRTLKIVAARNATFYALKEAKPALSSSQMARWFDKNHTVILYGIARHAMMNGLPPLTQFGFGAKTNKRGRALMREMLKALAEAA